VVRKTIEMKFLEKSCFYLRVKCFDETDTKYFSYYSPVIEYPNADSGHDFGCQKF